MIIPATQQFKVIQGATFDFRFQYLAGGQSSTTPVDLSSYSGNWTITSLDGTVPYLQYDNSGLVGTSGVFFGGDTQTPSNGIIDLTIIGIDTAEITWTSAAYIFSVTPPSLVQIPLIQGNIVVIGAL